MPGAQWLRRIRFLVGILIIPILASLAVGLSPASRLGPAKLRLSNLECALESCSEAGMIALVSGDETLYSQAMASGFRVTPFDWLQSFRDCDFVVIGQDVLRGQDKSSVRRMPETCLEELRQLRPLNDAQAEFLVFKATDMSGVARTTAFRAIDGIQPQVLNSPRLSDASGADQPSLSLCCHVMLLGDSELIGNMSVNSPSVALRALTDERFAEAIFGESPFVRTRHGVRYLLARSGLDGEKPWAESHRDQCLASLAALGIPLDQPLVLKDLRASVGSLLNESIANFSLGQAELAWTATAYSHYLPPQRSWKNRFDEECSFSTLLNQMIDVGYDQQSCGGMHVLESIIAILTADGIHDILTPQARVRGNEFLIESMELVVKNQRPTGDWGLDWNGKKSLPNIGDDVLITGHMLDLLSQSRRIPSSHSAVAQGVGWAANQLTNWSTNKAAFSVCPLTHILRVLAHHTN